MSFADLLSRIAGGGSSVQSSGIPFGMNGMNGGRSLQDTLTARNTLANAGQSGQPSGFAPNWNMYSPPPSSPFGSAFGQSPFGQWGASPWDLPEGQSWYDIGPNGSTGGGGGRMSYGGSALLNAEFPLNFTEEYQRTWDAPSTIGGAYEDWLARKWALAKNAVPASSAAVQSAQAELEAASRAYADSAPEYMSSHAELSSVISRLQSREIAVDDLQSLTPAYERVVNAANPRARLETRRREAETKVREALSALSNATSKSAALCGALAELRGDGSFSYAGAQQLREDYAGLSRTSEITGQPVDSPWDVLMKKGVDFTTTTATTTPATAATTTANSNTNTNTNASGGWWPFSQFGNPGSVYSNPVFSGAGGPFGASQFNPASQFSSNPYANTFGFGAAGQRPSSFGFNPSNISFMSI